MLVAECQAGLRAEPVRHNSSASWQKKHWVTEALEENGVADDRLLCSSHRRVVGDKLSSFLVELRGYQQVT